MLRAWALPMTNKAQAALRLKNIAHVCIEKSALRCEGGWLALGKFMDMKRGESNILAIGRYFAAGLQRTCSVLHRFTLPARPDTFLCLEHRRR